MTNESSAVSDLIRLTKTQRLRTDPADLFLFKPSTGQPPRMLEPHPGWAPPIEDRPQAAPRPRTVRPNAPTRPTRAWPIVLSLLLAGGIGIGLAAYFGGPATKAGAGVDFAAFVPAPPPPVVAPAPAPAPVVAPAPTIAPTIAPAIAEPVTAAAADEPAATPAPKHAKKRVVAKKHVKAKAPVRHVEDADDAPAPPPVKAAPVSKRPSSQAADKENPL